MEPKKRARITVKGKVQMVGFRNFVIELMKSLNLKGYANNLPDGKVKIVCEGGKREIEDLSGKIKKSPPRFARVDSAELEWQKFIGDLNEPERAGEDVPTKKKEATLNDVVNVLTRMDMKLEIGNERLGSIDGKQDKMLEKQDQMLGKQDQMLEKLDSFHQDTVQRFDKLDAKYGLLSEIMKEISESLRKIAEK